jgi:BRCT domain type II-containing protein
MENSIIDRKRENTIDSTAQIDQSMSINEQYASSQVGDCYQAMHRYAIFKSAEATTKRAQPHTNKPATTGERKEFAKPSSRLH